MDTAAVVKNLDLVVSADTAVAHLAGALGVPVWLALPFMPDWRWLLQREDSPWYPHHRLFRQSRWGDWDEVFQRIAAELRRLVDEPNRKVERTGMTTPAADPSESTAHSSPRADEYNRSCGRVYPFGT